MISFVVIVTSKELIVAILVVVVLAVVALAISAKRTSFAVFVLVTSKARLVASSSLSTIVFVPVSEVHVDNVNIEELGKHLQMLLLYVVLWVGKTTFIIVALYSLVVDLIVDVPCAWPIYHSVDVVLVEVQNNFPCSNELIVSRVIVGSDVDNVFMLTFVLKTHFASCLNARFAD